MFTINIIKLCLKILTVVTKLKNLSKSPKVVAYADKYCDCSVTDI